MINTFMTLLPVVTGFRTGCGGAFLCKHSPIEMDIQLERWGCPWSRRPDGDVNVRRFGGMKIERTWFCSG